MFKPCSVLLSDFYKQDHQRQYDPSITKVVSYYVPRKTSIPEFDKVVVFGIQAFIEEYLIEYMNENFFNRPLEEVIAEYEFVISSTMGVDRVNSDKIKKLHELGYLPIEIWARVLFDSDTTYYATKHRISRDKLEVKLPSEIKPNTSILVFDDLCDGGGTFFAIHKALQDIGVTDVHLRVRHAIQKEPLVKLSKLYKTITITNSYKDWDKEELPNNIKVIKVYD